MTHVFTQRLARGMILCMVAAGALTAGNAPAAAEIYEWVDEANARHYATSLESVPPEARSKARIVIGGATPAPEEVGTPSEAEREEGVAGTTRREREARTFASGWDVGFQAGWEAGFQAAAAQQPICPVQPNVVVLESRPSVVNVLPYDPAGVYYRPPFEGSMTVPFDAGRSRGLTFRQLEEQRR